MKALYLSTYTLKELAKMSRQDALATLGIYFLDELLVPPKCNNCGSPLVDTINNQDNFNVKDFDIPWQCTECGKLCLIYVYKDTFFLRGLV